MSVDGNGETVETNGEPVDTNGERKPEPVCTGVERKAGDELGGGELIVSSSLVLALGLRPAQGKEQKMRTNHGLSPAREECAEFWVNANGRNVVGL